MELYHSDIRLPARFSLPNRAVALVWTNHAKRARLTDRYGVIEQFSILNLGLCQTIEVGMEAGRVRKVVVRTKYDDINDIVVVLIPGPSKWTVKTVWLNRSNDLHKTLDHSRYVH